MGGFKNLDKAIHKALKDLIGKSKMAADLLQVAIYEVNKSKFPGLEAKYDADAQKHRLLYFDMPLATLYRDDEYVHIKTTGDISASCHKDYGELIDRIAKIYAKHIFKRNHQ